MTKTTTIVLVALLLWFLLSSSPGQTGSRLSNIIGGGSLYGPMPRPNYAISPPTHQSTAVTDVLSTALISGASVLNNYLSNGASASPLPVIQASTPVTPDAINFSELD